MKELPEMDDVMISEIFANFLKAIDFDVVERNANGIVLSSLLRHLLSNPSASETAYVNLKNGDVNGDGLFAIGDFYIQMSRKGDKNGCVSHYELIIADNNTDEGKKQLVVLTAKSVESELIEMD